MKRRFFIRTLGVLGLASLLPKQSSGSWASLASNQVVNGSNLQDAVDNGIFTLRPGKTITKTDQTLSVAEVQLLINCKPINLAADRQVRKADLIPLYPITTYFFLSIVSAADACLGSVTYNYTLLTDDIGGVILNGDTLWVQAGPSNPAEAFIWLESGQGSYYWIAFGGQWYKFETDSSIGSNGDIVVQIGEC